MKVRSKKIINHSTKPMTKAGGGCNCYKKGLFAHFGADKIIIGGLVAVTLITGAFLRSIKTKASTVDEITVAVPTACTLSGSISPGKQHSTNINPGTYVNNIGTTNLKALCNDFEGFSIYAIGYTNNTEGTTAMVGVSTGQTIASGTATSGDNSNWAMKLTSVAGTYEPTIVSPYSGYSTVPSNYTKVAYYTATSGSSATDQTIGSNLETTYAAYISSAQTADTYTSKVKYLLVHPASIDSISVNAITAEFQAYPGSSISFEDGSTTNRVLFRMVCEDPNDTDTCNFMVTDGEYKEPIGYKGAWIVPIPDGEGGYTMQTFIIQNGVGQWTAGLKDLGGSAFLGQTVPIYAYPGNAITYDGNGATAGEMSSVASRFGDTTIHDELASDEAELIAPNFYKTGYGFAGWSTSSSATPTNGATIYGPNQTVSQSSFSFDSYGNAKLYAVWVQSTGNLQNFTCSSLNNGSITALTDTRDGNVYTVGKLADGNCWMMENLRLDGYVGLNSSNTNNPAITSLGSSQDNWCANYTAACINQSIINTNNTNMGGVNSLGNSLEPNYVSYTLAWDNRLQWYGYGNYYNWYAATAGNGTYELGEEGAQAAGDICPAGWHLPSGETTSSEFYALNTAVNSGSEESSRGLRVYPANYVYSGFWNVSSAYNRASNGNYWSRTAYNSNYAYNLDFYDDNVYPGTYGWNRNSGFTVRCMQSGS